MKCSDRKMDVHQHRCWHLRVQNSDSSDVSDARGHNPISR